jgi:hypothetical protein
MKKIKIIGALSIVGTLGVGAMAASTMLTSCAKTYSIDESSIKVDDASANKAE